MSAAADETDDDVDDEVAWRFIMMCDYQIYSCRTDSCSIQTCRFLTGHDLAL